MTRTRKQRQADDDFLAKTLTILKEQFEAGDDTAVLRAVYHCLLARRPVPEWLCAAFVHAYEAAARSEARIWDDTFGPAQEEGIQLEPRKKHAALRERIAFRVAQRKPHEKIGDKGSLFSTIAKELKAEGVEGVGPSTVHKIYYERGGKELHEMIEMFRELRAATKPASTKN